MFYFTLLKTLEMQIPAIELKGRMKNWRETGSLIEGRVLREEYMPSVAENSGNLRIEQWPWKLLVSLIKVLLEG